MSHQKECFHCGKHATKVWRIDLDTSGIGMCDEHEDSLTLDIIVANCGGVEGWNNFIKRYEKIHKKTKIRSKKK